MLTIVECSKVRFSLQRDYTEDCLSDAGSTSLIRKHFPKCRAISIRDGSLRRRLAHPKGAG